MYQIFQAEFCRDTYQMMHKTSRIFMFPHVKKASHILCVFSPCFLSLCCLAGILWAEQGQSPGGIKEWIST